MREITQDQTDAHYAAVGRVAATWASFEHEIQNQIWIIAGVSNSVGACMTAQIGNSGRLLDCLIALLGVKGVSDDQLRPLRSFAGEVDKK